MSRLRLIAPLLVVLVLVLLGGALAVHSPGSRAANSVAPGQMTVTIPTGGGDAPTLTTTTPLTPQSAAQISRAAEQAGTGAAGVSVSTTTDSQATPAGFVGLSLEYDAIEPYAAAGKLFTQVVQNLTPGQRPVIRIGGDSADHSTVPIPGFKNTGVWGVWGTTWLADAKQIATELNAELTPDLDLEVDNPAVPAAEVKTMLAAIGSRYISAFELGNEPDLYSKFPWYAFNDDPYYTRSKSWDPAQYIAQLKATVGGLDGVDLWGPALGANSTWWSSLPQIAAAIPHLTTITYHGYPLSCYVPKTSDQYPTQTNLLSPSSSVGLADGVRPEVAFAARSHRVVRVDEINTVTCAGADSISTFASALWAIEAAFALDKVGVRGVNVHMFPKAAYRLFSFNTANTSVSAADEYYGWLLFARAAPTGSRQLATTASGDSHVHAFATTTGSATNVVLINDSASQSSTVTLSVPGSSRAVIEGLRSPGLSSKGGVSFAGLSIAAASGQLSGHPSVSALSGSGKYSVVVPAGSADLITLSP